MSTMRYSHRGKPQQQIYRPGSGPLRKSENKDIDINLAKEPDEKIKCTNGHMKDEVKSNKTDRYINMLASENQRCKKSEQALYVPKQIEKKSGTDVVTECHTIKQCDDSTDSNQIDFKLTKIPDNLKNTKGLNIPCVKVRNRDVREASEHRVFPGNTSRCSEKKEVDSSRKSHKGERNTAVPSTSRRNSTLVFQGEMLGRDNIRSISNLPPRLQKKFLLDNGYSLESLSIDKPKSNIFNRAGSTDLHNHYNINRVKQQMDSMNLKDHNNKNDNNSVRPASHTLPYPSGRGRGITHQFKSTINTFPQMNKQARADVPSNDYNDKCCDYSVNPSDNNLDFGLYASASFSRGIETQPINCNSTSGVTELTNSNENSLIVSNPASSHIRKLNWSDEVEMQDRENIKTQKQNLAQTEGPVSKRRHRRNNNGNNRRNRSCNRSSSRDSHYSFESSRKIKNCVCRDPRDANIDSVTRREIDSTVKENSSSNIEFFIHSDKKSEQNCRNGPASKNINVLDNLASKQPSAPGLLILPTMANTSEMSPNYAQSNNNLQRMLYDPNNPNKPIIVTQTTNIDSRVSDCLDNKQYSDVNGISKPPWYATQAMGFQSPKNLQIINHIEKLDCQLQWILKNGSIISDWNKVQMIRCNLEQHLHTLLVTDIKFCQSENVEHQFWKILFYNIIEFLRKSIIMESEKKEIFQNALLTIIDDGINYYERLLVELEQTYDFNLEDYLGPNVLLPPKGLRFVGLALVAAQKVFLFLGDLARYREQVCETTNYTKSKQYYMKAQQVNPKNGRPYNQLAILSVYARRKLDAVYYYMRSLMSSNPFHSARDSLLSLFDENRKKYESTERKRTEELERRKPRKIIRETSYEGRLRKETWIRPDSIPRPSDTKSGSECDTDEDLKHLSNIELNKRFIISYLHVHGKLITRVGMETFSNAARQMLNQFRLLLQRSPLPVNTHRLLQLVALNMFAIDATSNETDNKRTEIQDRALATALEMSSLFLERCITLIKSQEEPQRLFVPSDVQVMLPAIKVWCDWLLCHISIWNPPPFSKDLRVGSAEDLWSRLAELMGMLENIHHKMTLLTSEPKEGYSIVRLQEDTTLCGFTPLMYATPENVYAPSCVDPEAAQIALRLHKVQFFGTEFLCGVDPPVLKSKARPDGGFDYVSVLFEENEHEITKLNTEQISTIDSDEGCSKPNVEHVVPDILPDASMETRRLLRRKDELERKQKLHMIHEQRTKEILAQGSLSLEIEVIPKFLVPDTNCFIDYLDQLLNIAKSHIYTLMVPLVVLSELEGLSRGVAGVRDEVAFHAIQALEALRLRKPGIKFLTSRGNIFNNASFTAEDTAGEIDIVNNDDRILASAVSLSERDSVKTQSYASSDNACRKIRKDVVLLTMDRNLRVKALAADLPVRDLPNFIKWSGLKT